MSLLQKIRSTWNASGPGCWVLYKKQTAVEAGAEPVAVFDMRNLSPGRRITQISRQLCNAGYRCVFFYPNYYYWVKSTFFRNLNYWNVDLKVGNVIRHKPSTGDLLITRVGKGKLLDLPTLYFNDRIMDRIDKVKEKPFYYPILMHPDKATAAFEQECMQAPVEKRTIGMLFVGNNDASYTKNAETIHKLYHVHTRTEIIDHLAKELPDYIYRPETLEELLEAEQSGCLTNRIVIVDRFRVSTEYISLLKKARCFLITSGVVMPFCHNHIESIACGCIPVTEFGGFYPGLPEVCVPYQSLDELTARCREFCQRNLCNHPSQIEQSRQVKEYYRQYWSTDAFKRKLETLCSEDQREQEYCVADNYLH